MTPAPSIASTESRARSGLLRPGIPRVGGVERLHRTRRARLALRRDLSGASDYIANVTQRLVAPVALEADEDLDDVPV